MRRLYAVLFTLVAVVSTSLPAQANPIDSLAPGHWYKVPNSHLQDVALQPVDYQLRNIMDSWSGGAFDTKRHRLIVWGGGHHDYWGNEIYTFNVDTLKWQRINDPYLPAKGYAKIWDWGRSDVSISPINPDGTPDSRHTYDGLVYLPNQDRFWMNGGSIWPSGWGTLHTAEFNFDTGKWKYKADSPHGALDNSTAYDPVTGHIFEYWCGWIMEYDPVANTWATRGNASCEGHMVGEIDPVNRKFVILGGGRAFIYNITRSGWMSQKPLNAVGDGASVMKNANHPGLVYDSAIKKIVGWAGGTNVYTLDLSASTPRWEKFSPAAGNTVVPTPPAENGTYGRWQYVPSKNVFILVNSTKQDVYFYKLSAGAGTAITPTPILNTAPAPTVSISASPTSVTSGGSTTITWSSSNANSCVAFGSRITFTAWSGTKSTSGSQTFTNLKSTGTYTITCAGAGGTSAPRSVTVSVPATQQSPVSSSSGTIIHADSSNYLSKLSTLQPGDTLLLASGTYNNPNTVPGLPIFNINGTQSKPITIMGPNSGSRPVFIGHSGYNTIRFSNASYVIVKNIEVNNKNTGGDGVNAQGVSHDITLDNLYLHGLSDDQQTVGISTNHATTWNWTIKNNIITDAGTGMYLGNNPGDNPFIHGIIENNLIYGTIGYNIEIKQQNPRPTDISGMPTNSGVTIIRNNVFSKGSNSSSGGMARPDLLVGHFPLSGSGVNDLYEIYGNFFYQNPHEALFQGEGNVAFYDNVLVNTYDNGYAAITIQPQHAKPRMIRIFNNTIIAKSEGISVIGGNSNYKQIVIGNAVFSAKPIYANNLSRNVIGTYVDASRYLKNSFAPLGQMSLYPNSKSSLLLDAPLNTDLFNSGFSGTFDNWNNDFNGTLRNFTFAGAYVGSGTNTGWILNRTIKPLPSGTTNNSVTGTTTTPPPSSQKPIPTLTFSASPTSITTGGSTTLTWVSTNATSCSASGAWSGTKSIRGSQNLTNLQSTGTYIITCTGAGGSKSSSVSISVTTPTPTPTPTSTSSIMPTSIANIPVGKWIAVKTPARNKGIFYGDSTYDGMKHVSIALDPLNGRLYFEGGDYSGASGFHQSYQQETWSLDLAARLSDPTNRNAGWRLEYPYCGPSGQIQPKHPDTVGWVWDSRRNVFWIVPGVSVSSPALCSGETYSHNSDPGFIFKHMMTFNPATKKWTDVSSNVHGPYGNNWKAVYGPKTDTIIRFGYRNSAIAQVYNISKNTWTDYPLGKDALGRDIRVSNAFPAVDLKDRVIYVIDHSHGRLHRYHMDSHTMDDLGPIPGGPRHFYETYIAWDSTNRVLFWFDNIKRVFNIYHPDTKTWQTVSTATNIPGINAYGRTLIYDAHDNVLVLMGGVDPAPPSYFYLYRFGSGSGASPSVPVASLSFSADKGAVVSGGGVRLTWNGGNVSRCTASGGWSGAKAVSGSEVIGPLSADGIFTLTCSGSSGSVARSVAVSVTPAPAPSASPPALPTGGGVSGPAKPVLSSPGSGVGLRVRIAGAAFSDTDANAVLKESEWEVGTSSGFGAGAMVLDRRVAGNPGLSLPSGVLGVGKGYWVRTRHQDSQGKWSAWSGGPSFTTVAVDPRDMDGNGVDDRYQVAPGADANGDGIPDSQEGMCDLHDAQGGAVVGFKAGAGVVRCLTSVPVSALSGVSGFPGGSLPYGMFAFRIEGLPVDPARPATAQVQVYFPQALGAGAKWYQYDVVTGRVEPFPGAVSIVGDHATLTLVDGGIGDADGVVNGVLVDPSGPVVLTSASGASTTSPAAGGGAIGPFGIAVGLLVGWRRRRKRVGPPPAGPR